MYALPGFFAIAEIRANGRVMRLPGFAGVAETHAVELGRAPIWDVQRGPLGRLSYYVDAPQSR